MHYKTKIIQASDTIFKLKGKKKKTKKANLVSTPLYQNSIISSIYKTEVFCILSLYIFKVWCVFYTDTSSQFGLGSLWGLNTHMTLMVRRTPAHPFPLAGTPVYRHTAWTTLPFHLLSVQWTVRAVLHLTRDKWQLTGCHTSWQWGKRTFLSFLELSRISHSLSFLLASYVVTCFSNGAPWGREPFLPCLPLWVTVYYV